MKRLGLILLLAACQPEPPGFPQIDGMTGVEETECTGQGGQIVVGLAGPTCALPTADAGQSCRSGADCDGLCLAPAAANGAGQCSPVSPYFGCHEVLVAAGESATLCVD